MCEALFQMNWIFLIEFSGWKHLHYFYKNSKYFYNLFKKERSFLVYLFGFYEQFSEVEKTGWQSSRLTIPSKVARCVEQYWYHLYKLKNVKNTPRGVLLLVKLQTKVRTFTKSNIPSWVFFTFFKLNKCYQIAKGILYK